MPQLLLPTKVSSELRISGESVSRLWSDLRTSQVGTGLSKRASILREN